MTKQQFLTKFNATLENIKDLAGLKALEAVKQNGYALQYVHNQTPEICVEAVKQNGYALRFVHNQTPEICLEAVKQNSSALQFVDLSVFQDEIKTVTLELTEEQLTKVKEILKYESK